MPQEVQALFQPAATRRPMGRCTIDPASSGLEEGLAVRDVLVPSCSSDSCAGRAQCTLTRSPGVRCFLPHIGAAGFRVKQAWCQVAVWLGWVGLYFGGCKALNLCLSRVRTGVAAMRQECNYQLDTTKLGRKGGKKYIINNKSNCVHCP